MVRRGPKMSTLVVSAIRNLREIHGSTSKEIMDYIKSNYDAKGSTIQKQMHAALKRGLDYGILKRADGNYSLNIEPAVTYMPNVLPTEKHAKRKFRRGRVKPRTKVRVRSVKRRRSRSAPRKKRTSSKAERAKRIGRGKSYSRKHKDESVPKDSVVEPIQERDKKDNDKSFEDDRSARSKSREARSSSRSSCSSDRNSHEDDSQPQDN